MEVWVMPGKPDLGGGPGLFESLLQFESLLVDVARRPVVIGVHVKGVRVVRPAYL